MQHYLQFTSFLIVLHLNRFFFSFLHLSCAPSLQNLPLQYIYAMVFALEEINHSSTLLPGVKLGHHIHDSCALPAWALQAALSLVGGDTPSCNSNEEKIGIRAGNSF